MNTSQTTRGYISSPTGQPTTHDIHRTSRSPSNILPRKKSNVEFDRSVDAMAAPRTALNVQVNRVVENGRDVRPSSQKLVGSVSAGSTTTTSSNSSKSSSDSSLQAPSGLQKKPSCTQLLRKKSSQLMQKVAGAAFGQTAPPPLPQNGHTTTGRPRK